MIFWYFLDIEIFSCSKHPSATFSSYVRLRFGQSGIADPWMIFGEKSAWLQGFDLHIYFGFYHFPIYIWFTIPRIPGAYKCNTTVQKPLAEALGLGRGTPLGSWRCIPTRPRRHEFRQIIGRFPGKKHAPCYHPPQVGSLILLYIHIKEDTVHIHGRQMYWETSGEPERAGHLLGNNWEPQQ